MRLPKDWREFIGSLNSGEVEYLIVGAFALAFYGFPRYTGDIDILVRASPDNARKVAQVISAFGFGSLGLSENDFLTPGQVIQLGLAPNRIDLLTSITGVEFEDAWQRRVAADLDGVSVLFIDRGSLIKNKRATGRTQDNADLEALGSD
jgi:hypothetical protein